MKNRILVVEDENIIAMDIKNRLSRIGHEVVSVVPTGEEAVEAALEKKPDLVLMDILLRGKINGINAAKQILEKESIPIIFISSYCDEDTVKRATEISPYGYLIKPFNENELKEKIKNIFLSGNGGNPFNHSRNNYSI